MITQILIRIVLLWIKLARKFPVDDRSIKRLNESAFHLWYAIDWLNGTHQSVYWTDGPTANYITGRTDG